MTLLLSSLTLLATFVSPVVSQSGESVAERYWDCCKPDCAWYEKADFSQPVLTCNAVNELQWDPRLGSACGGGGSAYSCADQSPWAVNDTLSYGFAGVFIVEHASDHWCCACYELSFTDGEMEGKTMIVQATNAAFEVVDHDRFILAIPGGNTSYANACSAQYDVPRSTFGIENEGVSSREDCGNLPKPLREGCYWRFDWLQNERRPSIKYKRVTCPEELTNITQCVRSDDTTFPSAASLFIAASPLAYATLIAGMLFVTMYNPFIS